MTQFDSSYTGDNKNGRTLYFSEKTLPADKTIQELKNSGVLTVVIENKVIYNTELFKIKKLFKTVAKIK